MPDDYRRKCFEEYEERCFLCGDDHNIEVHHIDGDRSNNDVDNLMPICPDCHNIVHNRSDPQFSEWTDLVYQPTQTPEDKLVTHALNRLSELTQFADGPELTLALGGDTALSKEYGNSLVPLDEFEGTEWATHVQDIINWAEDAGFTVSVDTELHTADLPREGRVIVNAAVRSTDAPLWMNVFCEVDGRVEVKIQAAPIDRGEEVYDGSVADLDVASVRAKVNEFRPFVTGRVSELIEEAAVKPSHARAIALREVGLTHDQVADHLDITKGASGSYQSKFNNSVTDAEHLFITRTPVPRRVLAKRAFDHTHYLEERWYVCEEVRPPGEQTDTPITVSVVKGDFTREGGVELDLSTMKFASLQSCIEELYAESHFPDEGAAQQRHDLFASLSDDRLVDAGFDQLPHPETRVHPDF